MQTFKLFGSASGVHFGATYNMAADISHMFFGRITLLSCSRRELSLRHKQEIAIYSKSVLDHFVYMF